MGKLENSKPNHFKIITQVYQKSQRKLNKKALLIIYFATTKGLGCRNTAQKIMADLETSNNPHETIPDIVEELLECSYFHPTPKVSELIASYLEKCQKKINPNDDLDPYGEYDNISLEITPA